MYLDNCLENSERLLYFPIYLTLKAVTINKSNSHFQVVLVSQFGGLSLIISNDVGEWDSIVLSIRLNINLGCDRPDYGLDLVDYD